MTKLSKCPQCGTSENTGLFILTLLVIDEKGTKTSVKEKKGVGLIGGILLIIFGIGMIFLTIPAFSYSSVASPFVFLIIGLPSLGLGINSIVFYTKYSKKKKVMEYKCSNCGFVLYEQEGKTEISSDQLQMWSNEASQIAVSQLEKAREKADEVEREKVNSFGSPQQYIDILLEQSNKSLIKQNFIATGNAIDTLAKIGSNAVEPAIKLLNESKNIQIQLNLINVLGRIGDVRAIEVLREKTNNVNKNDLVAKAAIDVLKRQKWE